MNARITRLYENYHTLRDAGYTNAEASRLKHHSRATISYLVAHAPLIIVDYRKERENRLQEALTYAKENDKQTI